MHRFVDLVTATRANHRYPKYLIKSGIQLASTLNMLRTIHSDQMPQADQDRERAISAAAECLEEVWLKLEWRMNELLESIEKANRKRFAGKLPMLDKGKSKDKGKEEHSDTEEDSCCLKGKKATIDEDDRKKSSRATIFKKEIAESICPLIDGFYLVCSNDIPHPSVAAATPSKSPGDQALIIGKQQTDDAGESDAAVSISTEMKHKKTSPSMERFVNFMSIFPFIKTLLAFTHSFSISVDRHTEVVRSLGSENVELLVGSLEFILESVTTHPEWRFKGT